MTDPTPRTRSTFGRNTDGTIPLPDGDVLTHCDGCGHAPIRETWLRECPRCGRRLCLVCWPAPPEAPHCVAAP